MKTKKQRIFKSKEATKKMEEGQQDVLKSIRVNRIILPILIGVGFVIYSVLNTFDWKEFQTIIADSSSTTLFWIGVAIIILVIRHLAYATRLRVLSEGVFSWRKCIELIFIWEFSAAVTPTSVGGSAVAFFVLSQEKLSTAKTATIVLYTIVLDTIFFVATLPILFLFFGTDMIRPEQLVEGQLYDWTYYFLTSYGLMATYGTIFYWGLFRSPNQIKKLLNWITNVKFLKRFNAKAIKMGDEMIIASKELKQRDKVFHTKAFLSTVVAWSCRFLLINALIIAFINIPVEFWTQFRLYARLEAMFVIVAFAFTPGGAGFVEALFSTFLVDMIPSSTYSLTIATLWRILTYYSYLLIGVVIVPNWIRTVLNQRNKNKKQKQ